MSLTAEQRKQVTEHNEAIWTRCAPTYTRVFEPLTSGATTALLDLAGVGRTTALLDIGTGPGTVIGPALERGAQVKAVDLSAEMVSTARARHPGIDITVGDATTLPFPDHSHDAITMGFCLHHAADPHAVLCEAQRILRPGGRIAFTVWAAAEQLEAFGIAFTAVAESIPSDDAVSSPQPPNLGDEPADYEDVLTRAGFSHPTARTLQLSWNVADGATMFDGFDRFLNLTGQPPDIRAQIRRRLDQLIHEERSTDGLAHLDNPAIVAAATKT